jgi:hemolysin activation/secretion protein
MKNAGLAALATLLALSAGAADLDTPRVVDEPQRFDVNEIRVLGNTSLRVVDVESAVYPYLGPNKVLQDIEEARDALVAAYRAAGLGTVLVDIPEQSVDDGLVRLQVTEGKIDSVRIRGGRYYSERKILAQLPSVSPGKVPVLPELQRELNDVASQSRDREVTPVLKPGRNPGTVDVEFLVKDQLPLHGSVELNNRYTADTAELRATASVNYDNLFDRQQSLGLMVQTAPQRPSEVQVAVLNYSGPTGWRDVSWSSYAIHSRSNVAAVGTLNVVGNGVIVGGRINETLSADANRLTALSFGFDYKDFQQNITLTDATAAKTPVRYLLWSAQLNQFRRGIHWDTQWTLSGNWGIRGLMNNETQFNYARYAAHAGFAYLRTSANATRHLAHDWSVVFRLAGQYAEQPLVNNEQFALGGVDTVRGYLDASTLADAGVAATIELRLPVRHVKDLAIEPYAFFDRGSGLIQEPLLDQIKRGLVRSNLEGWGAGLRVHGLSGLELNFDISTPLLDGTDLVGPKDHQIPRIRRGDTRVDFNVRYAY